jgi:2-amino-4-hydroxy-6-hydroxymethyldihydropteridine diphosphokinase
LTTVYLSLGSNLGDREANLRQARERFHTDEMCLLRESSIYETEPRDVPDQPWFLNQVVEVETSLLPRELLEKLQRIETEMGRKRGVIPKGPRLIDLDILLAGNAVVNTPDLEIPHPGLAERRFVLEPLAELSPELRHPRTGQTVREMLTRVTGQAVSRYSPPSPIRPDER